jgi:hypothetical protein
MKEYQKVRFISQEWKGVKFGTVGEIMGFAGDDPDLFTIVFFDDGNKIWFTKEQYETLVEEID